jgi:hypothetical protein
MVAFGEWSPSEIGRSEIGRSEIGRTENGHSENGRCTILSASLDVRQVPHHIVFF